MTKHESATRQEWLAARLPLLEAEKELTRREAGCPSCSGIADGFDGIAVHLRITT
jgi:predicted dithiol-disulfide oxidoreductase (DUF899 family)